MFEAPLDSLARAVMASSLIARRMPNRPAFKLASSRKRVRPCLKGRQRGGHSPPYGLSPQPHSSHFPDGGRLQNFVTKVLGRSRIEDDLHRCFRTRETAAETSERVRPAARACFFAFLHGLKPILRGYPLLPWRFRWRHCCVELRAGVFVLFVAKGRLPAANSR